MKCDVRLESLRRIATSSGFEACEHGSDSRHHVDGWIRDVRRPGQYDVSCGRRCDESDGRDEKSPIMRIMIMI